MKNIITATILSLSIMSCSSSEQEDIPIDEWFLDIYNIVSTSIIVIENTKKMIEENGINDDLHKTYIVYAKDCRVKTVLYNNKSINYDEAFFEMLELPKSLILTNCY